MGTLPRTSPGFAMLNFENAIEALGGEAYSAGILANASRWNITTPLQQAHWLAQIAHESGGFVHVRELWGPTPQQRRYERNNVAPWPSSRMQAKQDAFKVNRLAYSLGNTLPGDGIRYRGRGFIQVTGRANYLECSRDLFGDDRLLAEPELLEQSPATSAGWYWHSRNINRFADVDDVRAVTRAINGGLTGLADRMRLLDLAKDAMADAFRCAINATH